MKRLPFICIVLAALLPAAAALAATPEETDQTARTAERLIALGYAQLPAAALGESEIEAILTSDAFDEPLERESLFSPDAAYAPLPETNHALTENAISIAAEPLDWASAAERITFGAAYALKGMDTGAVVRMRCVELTDSYAGFAPLSVWDAATLGGIFDGVYDFRLVRCALTIGETAYLSYAMVTPADLDAESGEPAVCRLYFDGSAPRLGAVEGVGGN